jgi:hypothetical protein
LAELLAAIDRNDLLAVDHQLTVQGVNPNALVGWRTPLVAAVGQFRDATKLRCNESMVVMLLRNGADPNGIDQRIGTTPLHYALSLGEIKCAQLLRAAGAAIISPIPGKKTVLAEAVNGAALSDNMAAIDLVLSWGVDPNVQRSQWRRRTALFEASYLGKASVVRHLLARGADPCYRDADGETALASVNKYTDRDGETRRLLTEVTASKCRQ